MFITKSGPGQLYIENHTSNTFMRNQHLSILSKLIKREILAMIPLILIQTVNFSKRMDQSDKATQYIPIHLGESPKAHGKVRFQLAESSKKPLDRPLLSDLR